MAGSSESRAGGWSRRFAGEPSCHPESQATKDLGAIGHSGPHSQILRCAQDDIRDGMSKSVGQPVLMPDAEERVRGTLTFTGNFEVPGMLHGKILRSPHAHARITRLDASRAERLPGVIAVLTGDDLRDAAINSH